MDLDMIFCSLSTGRIMLVFSNFGCLPCVRLAADLAPSLRPCVHPSEMITSIQPDPSDCVLSLDSRIFVLFRLFFFLTMMCCALTQGWNARCLLIVNAAIRRIPSILQHHRFSFRVGETTPQHLIFPHIIHINHIHRTSYYL